MSRLDADFYRNESMVRDHCTVLINRCRIPRPDELERRPEMASISTLIAQLEIGRRALRAALPSAFLLENSKPLTDPERRIRGIELRLFYLLLDLEDFLLEILDDLQD